MFLSILLCFFPILIRLVHAQGVELLQLYAPTVGSSCPDISQNPLLREFTSETQALHPQESTYVGTRESTVIQTAWQDWLGTGSQIGYNVSLLSKNFSRIGIAFSGGGFRAAQYSAGVTSALDGRDQSAKSAGTGGLLQVASYISGLSGKLYHSLFLVGRNLKRYLYRWLMVHRVALPERLYHNTRPCVWQRQRPQWLASGSRPLPSSGIQCPR